MRIKTKKGVTIWGIVIATLFLVQSCGEKESDRIPFQKDAHIVLIGNNLASRMINFGHFETEMHLRYPDSTLFIRNMADPGQIRKYWLFPF